MVSAATRVAGKYLALAVVCLGLRALLAPPARKVSCGLMNLKGELSCDKAQGPCDSNRAECKRLQAEAKALCPGEGLHWVCPVGGS